MYLFYLGSERVKPVEMMGSFKSVPQHLYMNILNKSINNSVREIHLSIRR